MPISELTDDEVTRLYGPWAERTPADAARLLAGYPGPWWIAGGWAIEAFTGAGRHHGDLDVEVLRADLPLLCRHLAGRLDVWTAVDGALRPLLPGDDPDGAAEAVLPAGCGQVWVRPGGAEPWEYDILLMPGNRDTWEFKRDRRIQLLARPTLDDCNRAGFPVGRVLNAPPAADAKGTVSAVGQHAAQVQRSDRSRSKVRCMTVPSEWRRGV